MPASVNKKCFACAFNTIEFAKEQTCWDSDRCQPKRSYYRKRESINANRRAKYKQALTKNIEIIQIKTPSVTAAFLQIYRQGRAKDSPVHALEASIVVDGVNCAKIEPVHTQGWNKKQLDILCPKVFE